MELPEDEVFIRKSADVLHECREKLPKTLTIKHKRILKIKTVFSVKFVNESYKVKLDYWRSDHSFSLKWGPKKHKFKTLDECLAFLSDEKQHNDVVFLKAIDEFNKKETFLEFPYNKYKRPKFDSDFESVLCYSNIWLINYDGSFTLRNPDHLLKKIISSYEGNIDELKGKTFANKEEMSKYFTNLLG